MKFLVVSTLLISGLCHARIYGEDISKNGVLKRVVRNAVVETQRQLLQVAESFVISNCKKATDGTDGDDLQSTYDEMNLCMDRKPILLTPKNDYHRHMEECSRDAIRKTRNCLAGDQKYFPKFFLDVYKSVISLVYDDFWVYIGSMPLCMEVFSRSDVQRKYIQCVIDAAVETQYTIRIPSSKASLCRIFIPAAQCFTDMIKYSCENNLGLKKFRDDYFSAIKGQCEKKDTLLK